MNTQIQNFQTEIQSVAMFATRIGFNVETGDFDKLMRDWIEDGRKRDVFIQDNKNSVIGVLKHLTK